MTLLGILCIISFALAVTSCYQVHARDADAHLSAALLCYFRLGLPFVRFFPDMSGILEAKYAPGRNVKKCFNVRDFGIMPFMKSNNVFTVGITKC